VEVDLHSMRGSLALWAFSLGSILALAACAFGPVDTGFQGSQGSGKPETFFAPGPDASTADTSAAVADDASPDAAATSDLPDTSPPFDSGRQADTAVPAAQCTLTFPTQMPTCDSCIGQSCCAEDNTCGGDQACLAVVDCMSQCASSADAGANPTACFNACARRNPSGANILAALEQCVQGQCLAACQ
jgi:hypothetical protein